MSNPLEKGVCDNKKSKNKVVFDHCVVCRCCESPPVCILKKIASDTKIKAYINLPEKLVKKQSIRRFRE